MRFNVKWKGQSGIEKSLDFPTLDTAMTFSKTLGIVVTISNGDFEVVGKFGVDSIRNGRCPDGTVYDWNKASRIGATRRR
jgi:hypothetical protein